MTDLTEQLFDIRLDLTDIQEQQGNRVWRLARRAYEHRCSWGLINSIRDEGWRIRQARPFWLLDTEFTNTLHYFGRC